jgi:hypothetical protein
MNKYLWIDINTHPMYMCIYIYMSVTIYRNSVRYIDTYIYIHIYIYIYIYVYVYVYVIRKYANMETSVFYIKMILFSFISIYHNKSCTKIDVYQYSSSNHTYIHTYIHISIDVCINIYKYQPAKVKSSWTKKTK